MQSQVRLNRVPKKVPKKVPEKVPGGFGAESGQVQQGSKGSGEGLGGFGAEQVRFNRVPEKVLEKVPGSFGAKPSQVQRVPEKGLEKAWEALVQSQVRSNRSGEGSGEGSGRLWCRVRSGQGSKEGSEEGLGGFGAEQVRFNRVPEKVPEKVPGSLGAKPSQVQRVPEKALENAWGALENAWEALVQSQVRFNRSDEGSGQGLRGFGAEPCQVQQGSGEGSGREALAQGQVRFRRRSGRLWCRARFNRVPEKVPEKVPGKVPEKVPEKVPGSLGAKPSHGLWRRLQRRSRRRFWESLVQGQVRSKGFIKVSSALLRSTLQKDLLKKRCGCWG